MVVEIDRRSFLQATLIPFLPFPTEFTFTTSISALDKVLGGGLRLQTVGLVIGNKGKTNFLRKVFRANFGHEIGVSYSGKSGADCLHLWPAKNGFEANGSLVCDHSPIFITEENVKLFKHMAATANMTFLMSSTPNFKYYNFFKYFDYIFLLNQNNVSLMKSKH